ncbi:MAG TPA: cell division protein FtsA [Chthoniobacterales bacterium]|jgi:cell division protein FtsA
MARDDIVVGLEIGTSKICVVVAEDQEDGTIKILGVGQVPSRGIRKGEIVDFDTAQQCLHDALVDAEQKSDIEIDNVFVGITGSHILSFNSRGVVTIPEEKGEIDEEDIANVKASAIEVSIPGENSFLHQILQHYYIDDREGVLNPVGIFGGKLEADYHIIHGIRNRIHNTLRCVREIPLKVADVVLNGLASAQVVLDQEQKNLGALVLDIGGGTTDYVLYHDGAVRQSGVLAVGGDHITNDISMLLKIPMARAERLKIEEGSVILGNTMPGEKVLLKDETGFAGREIEREKLNTIIHMRMKETFELLLHRLENDPKFDMVGSGVHITGGCSLLKGIDHLASEVFGMEATLTHARTMAGITSAFQNPQYSTAIGLVKYAQAVRSEQPHEGILTKLFNPFKKIFRR